jgi:hypothetical protein
MSIWKKAILWTKIKDTFALGGILGQAGMEVLNTNQTVQVCVAVGTVIGYLVGMWMEDKDHDGVVDIFQTEVKVKSESPIDVQVKKKGL